ncbi:MAG: hypothetical protein IK100_01745 [Muribaculaceae bacterium]|nr:hypothetical protein [Muribaculaceae bacterium]
MKRTILISTFALATLSAFAYGYYDDSSSSSSSGWLVFMGIVFFIWGILEIILFFKIWKMTNDVDKLRASLVDDKASTAVTRMNLSQLRDSVKQKFFIGKVEEAFDDLNLFTYKRISNVGGAIAEDISGNEYMYMPLNGEWQRVYNYKEKLPAEYNRILTEMSPLYKAIGKEIPEALKNVEYNAFQNFGKEVEVKE